MSLVTLDWPQLIGSLGGTAAFGAWLNHRLRMRKQTDDMSLGIVAQVQALLSSVTAAREEDRRFYEDQSRRQEQMHTLCEANLKHEHHRVNNLVSTIRSVFDMAEISPESMPAILSKARDRMAEDKLNEQLEKASILAMRSQFGLPPENDDHKTEHAA